ncbi:protein A16-like [Anopheles nili]|uniref:protein A16-like n=1 Tax=Anopheles nili TaxID=185578 RepID=UPI00237B9295|nr:protein A16-like [Anopheles nili]
MLQHRSLIACLAKTILILTFVASSPTNINKTDTRIRSTRSRISELNNFPVNGLPSLTYTPKIYTFYDEWVTFFAAWDKCRNMGKRLATIESYRDHVAFREAYLPYGDSDVITWIAATNLGARSNEYQKFYWITNDRPVGYISGFQNWIDGIAPNISDMCAAAFLGSAVWLYGSCENTASYACEESQHT